MSQGGDGRKHGSALLLRALPDLRLADDYSERPGSLVRLGVFPRTGSLTRDRLKVVYFGLLADIRIGRKHAIVDRLTAPTATKL